MTYPVKVRAEKMGIRITDETGKIVNEGLKSGEELTISNSLVTKLNVSADLIPVEYALAAELSESFQSEYKDRIFTTGRCKQCNINNIQCIGTER